MKLTGYKPILISTIVDMIAASTSIFAGYKPILISTIVDRGDSRQFLPWL